MDIKGGWTFYTREPHSTAELKLLTGKHMFYSSDRARLERLAKSELLEHGFQQAKIPNIEPNGQDSVLILFDKDTTRGKELRKRSKNIEGIDYRGWKSNEQTHAGIYSEKFLRRPR